MKRIAIMGLGLMGGSLGLALRRHDPPISVAGYARRTETRNEALAIGAVDEAFERPEDAAAEADMVVLCVPVLAMAELTRLCMPSISAGCVITDVGSTKTVLAGEMRKALAGTGSEFVGSHPIAGSEKTGLKSADGSLYEDAVVVVTDDECGRESVVRVTEMWRSLGSRVITMRASEHDRILARTSHLPHLVAAMLVENLWRDNPEDIESFVGSGFRDATRIAAGSREIWHDIVKTNSGCISRELDAFARIAVRVKALIDGGDFEGVRKFLSDSANRRRNLEGRRE